MVVRRSAETSGYCNAKRRGTLLFNFSAVSLRCSSGHIFDEQRFQLPKHPLSADENGDTPKGFEKSRHLKPPESCFVVFSVKVEYKVSTSKEEWQLCSTVETKPILSRFNKSNRKYTTCLLKHQERLPLYLMGRRPAASHNGVPTGSKSDFIPCTETDIGENSCACSQCAHLSESHLFKIAIDTAVIYNGNVVYAGHGLRLLRAKDLFGTRIAFELFGDSCITDAVSGCSVSDACVFVNINIKDVKFISSTKQYDNIHAPNLSLQSQESCTDAQEYGSVQCLEKYTRSGSSAIVSREQCPRSSDIPMSRDSISDSELVPLKECITYHLSPSDMIVSPSQSVTANDICAVYVGSDPKYRVSVLDINNLVNNVCNRNDLDVVAQTNEDELVLNKPDTANNAVEDENGLSTQLSVTPNSPHIPVGSPEDKIVENEALKVKANDAWSFSSQFSTFFGGENQEPSTTQQDSDASRPLINVASENKEKITEARELSTFAMTLKLPRRNHHTFLLKIGHLQRKPGHLTLEHSTGLVLDRIFDGIAATLKRSSCGFSVKRVWIEANEAGSFVCALTIPDKGGDLDYAKHLTQPFYNLPLDAIGEIAILLNTFSSNESEGLQYNALREMFMKLKIGCEMYVSVCMAGNNLDEVTPFDWHEPDSHAPCLRATQSETAAYVDTALSNALDTISNDEQVKCESERDKISLGSWINTIKRIMVDNEGSTIQITSPRTALPINTNQRWAIMLKRMLESIKTDENEELCSDAIKFIWPVAQ
ncbi:hypothetical protein, conserved [Babesia bigemina]|uniref:Uncharacterized protein n=1 Tax=Babesia bigemina TaxID=5866 RepID=A0A061DEY4_BABBI|nr:hypothetical protein, conserved [Babesia bigemina]CDR98085.1 hypothetical protein, conserved [Babesia bigemina]|eukprot:XP_012770271.1 hypothetical protein, conserved [Babesia bigemina]